MSLKMEMEMHSPTIGTPSKIWVRMSGGVMKADATKMPTTAYRI